MISFRYGEIPCERRFAGSGANILARNNLWLTTVLRSIGDAVIACDADGRIVFMNEVAEELTGWAQHEASDRDLREIFCIVHEATRVPVESPVDKVKRLGTVVGLANHTLLLRRDRTEISIDDSGAPIYDDQGKLAGIVLIFRDISTKRRAERNMELLSESGRALAAPLDFDETLKRIARLSVQWFSDFCYFDLLQDDGTIDRTVRVHRIASEQALLDEALRAVLHRTARHPVTETLAKGEPTLVEQVTDEWMQSVALNEVHLRSMRALGLHTLLSVPVRVGDHTFGTLSFARTVNPAAFNEEDGRVAQELAARVASALDNARLYRSVQEARETARMERERYRALFLHAPAPILMMSGPEHRITLANEGYIRLLRRQSSADVLNKGIREVLPELEGQGFFERLDEVYRSGVPYVGREVQAFIDNARSGETDAAYFNFVYQPTRDTAGNVDGILALAVEITEQVRARKETEGRELLVKRQASELEAVYKTAPIGLALFDPVEFRYLRLNDRQAQIVGLPAGEILGKTLTEIAPIEGLNEMFRSVAQGNPIKNALIEGELPSQPGEHRYWTVNYYPVYGEDGRVEAITAASLEITAQKRAERALVQNEKIAAVGRLASSIAHEINNPLESITNLMYIARHTQDVASIHEYLDIADRELRRISLIASQTLRFYRQSTKPQAVTCEALVNSVLSLYQGRLLNSGVAVETGDWVKRPIVCFEGEIRQVLANLVGNALDAMPHGGKLVIRSKEITDWASGAAGVVMTFADTGSGMTAAVQKRIFEPFFSTKEMNGTGLGLWISRDIVTKHGGWLRVRSRSGAKDCGTVFRLYLPFDSVVPNVVQTQETSILSRMG
jgi:PAS domain S-box-containing protein